MNNSKNNRTKLLLTLLIAVLIVGYRFMFGGGVIEDSFLDDGQILRERIVNTHDKVLNINFDDSVINDEVLKPFRIIEAPNIQVPIG